MYMTENYFSKDISKIIFKYLGKKKIISKQYKTFKIKKRKEKYYNVHYYYQ